jgi:membrane protein implicated in regulation of membrane protease activity
MSMELGWLLLGLALIVVELLTGTFYLLIFGIAAIVGSAVAWGGGGFWLQAVVVAAAAVAGSLAIRRRRAAGAASPNVEMDVGQTVVVEEWVSEPQRLARVRYRGASWDAVVQGSEPVAKGAVLFICGVDGSRLKVAVTRPSS